MEGNYSKRQVFFAACVGMTFFGVCLISLGSVLPSISSKFGLNELQTSKVVTLLPAGILTGSVVFGPFVDRFGYKFLLITSSLLTAAGLLWIAYADTLSWVRPAVFLMGFGGGILNGETNTMVSDISGEDRNANLSFLAIFFGLGALGVPLLMGSLSSKHSFGTIITGIAIGMLVMTTIFFLIRFPLPKQPQGFPVKEGFRLLREPLLLLLSFVLFFQSGMEGLSNNWTTTYLENHSSIAPERALFSLTFMVAGMTVTRLLLGLILRKVKSFIVILAGLIIVGCGIIFLLVPVSEIAGVTLLGIGFAPVFPVVLGYIGSGYPGLSGTAFSIALFIALTGNTSLNYLMGIVSGNLSIGAFPLMLLACLLVMAVLLVISFKKNKSLTKS